MILNKLKKILFTTTLIFCSFTILSQVVNIEKKRKGEQDGFTGVLGMGFFLIDNGKSIIQFNNIIDLQYRKGPHIFILINDLNLMTVDNNDLINSGFQHIRYNYIIRDSSFITLEAFAQEQYNTIKLLKQRFLIGAGPRFRFINTKRASLFIGTIGMYEYEQLSDSLKTKTEFARLGSYLSFSWNIRPNLNFNSITYYQPVITEFQRYRVSSETNFELKISDAVSFKVGLQTTYDSHPPENVQRSFYTWENSLRYEF